MQSCVVKTRRTHDENNRAYTRNVVTGMALTTTRARKSNPYASKRRHRSRPRRPDRVQRQRRVAAARHVAVFDQLVLLVHGSPYVLRLHGKRLHGKKSVSRVEYECTVRANSALVKYVVGTVVTSRALKEGR